MMFSKIQHDKSSFHHHCSVVGKSDLDIFKILKGSVDETEKERNTYNVRH